jgi:hypothetical protein
MYREQGVVRKKLPIPAVLSSPAIVGSLNRQKQESLRRPHKQKEESLGRSLIEKGFEQELDLP